MIEPSAPQVRELWFPFAIKLVHGGKWAKLSMAAKALYPAISAFANFDTAECFPSLNTLISRSGLSRRSVQKGIRDLVKAGLIVRDSGDHTHSNRYKVVEWPRVPSSPPPSGPQATTYPTPGIPARREVGYVVAPNDLQLTTSKRTTTTPRGDGDLGSGVLKDCASELGLRSMGKQDLEELLDRYGADWLRAATEEAVSRGQRTLAYVKGILRKWDTNGRASRASKRAATAEMVLREREESTRKGRAVMEARELVQKRLAECSEEEIAGWTREAEVEAGEKRIPAMGLKTFLKSRILIRVAEKFGIEGV